MSSNDTGRSSAPSVSMRERYLAAVVNDSDRGRPSGPRATSVYALPPVRAFRLRRPPSLAIVTMTGSIGAKPLELTPRATPRRTGHTAFLHAARRYHRQWMRGP